MVINKKGFLKILEAIIAIVIVLSFVVAVIPTNQNNNTRLPPDLDETTNSFLDEMRNNPLFRERVLSGDAEISKNYIDFLSTPVSAHPWNYAIKICQVDSDSNIIDCNYAADLEVIGEEWAIKDNYFRNNILSKDKDIYIKTITLSFPDVSGKDPEEFNVGEYSILTLYAWSKV